MNRKSVTLIVLIFCSFATSLFSQDVLNMLNGGRFDVKILDTTSAKISISYQKKNNTKQISIEKDDIYSIQYANGNEVFFYKQDSLSDENYMTRAEMGDYIAGERDAVKGFKSPGATVGSFVVGSASAFLPLLILTPVPPAAFIGIVGARWVKIKRKNVSDNKYLKSDTYVMGYDHAARGKRLQNSLIGGGCGLALGIIARFVVTSVAK